MSTEELAQKLESFIQTQMRLLGTPGVSLVVVYENQVVYANGFGVTSADPEQAVAITPNTLFRIGSTTKPMTGTLLMRLVGSGKLALDEPIVTYLPWFTLSRADAAPCVTLRHLMSHQSGLPWGAQFFGHRDPSGLEAFVREQVPRLPLIAPPGTLFSYSNVGVNVAGCVAEAVGGASFAELMQTWVFDPLAMGRTTFDPLKAISLPLAQAHEKKEGNIQVNRLEPWAENVAYRPSAMAYSTVLDVANFARLHLNRGKWNGQQLLPLNLAAEMQESQVDEYMADGRTVGLNFALTRYRSHRRVGHGGGIGSFGSVFTMLPDVGVAVILQFNEGSFWQATEEIVRQVFDAALQYSEATSHLFIPSLANPVLPEPADRQRCVGTFLGARSGLVRLSVGDDETTLKLSRPGTLGETVLSPLHRDLYTGRNPITNEEEIVGFIGMSGSRTDGVCHIMLNGTPCARIEPNLVFVAAPYDWQRYAGDYIGPDETSPSGSDVLNLQCEDDALLVYSHNRKRREAAIAWDDECFVYRGQFLRFQKQASIEVNPSFTLGEPMNLYERLDH